MAIPQAFGIETHFLNLAWQTCVQLTTVRSIRQCNMVHIAHQHETSKQITSFVAEPAFGGAAPFRCHVSFVWVWFAMRGGPEHRRETQSQVNRPPAWTAELPCFPTEVKWTGSWAAATPGTTKAVAVSTFFSRCIRVASWPKKETRRPRPKLERRTRSYNWLACPKPSFRLLAFQVLFTVPTAL